MSLLNSLGTGSEVEEDGMFELVLEQGLEYQISVVENTVTTDAKLHNDAKLEYGRRPLFIPQCFLLAGLTWKTRKRMSGNHLI